VAGDDKYGKGFPKTGRLALHARSLTFSHPFSKKRLAFEAPTPDYFRTLIDYAY
jgi:tRNA pseudouridine32 synthase/23S rRNA pseudouridine746 synthase/23S rRNA pseudouridine1911/1915/1917 synthase